MAEKRQGEDETGARQRWEVKGSGAAESVAREGKGEESDGKSEPNEEAPSLRREGETREEEQRGKISTTHATGVT